MKHAVIFAFTENDAEYACQYKLKHRSEDVHIIAPTIPARLYLEKNNIDGTEYASLEFGQKNYYFRVLENEYSSSRAIFHIYEKLFNEATVFSVPLINILQTNFELEIIEVLHSHRLFTLMEKRWRPSKYILPDYAGQSASGYSPNIFSLAVIMAQYYIPKYKIYRFRNNKNTPKNNIIFTTIKTVFLRLRRVIVYRNILIRKYFDILFSDSKLTECQVLFFSFGFHLYYYHRLLKKLELSKKINVCVIAGEQSLGEEQLLIDKHIHFKYMNKLISERLKNNAKNEEINVMEKIKSISNDVVQTKLVNRSINNAIFQQFRFLAKRYGYKYALYAGLSKMVIEQTRPKLVITTHDPGPRALPLVIWAHQYKAKTLVLYHGLTLSPFGMSYASDFVAVWGRLIKKKHQEIFGRKKRIYSVGFPFLDDIIRYSPLKKTLRYENKKPIRIGIISSFYLPTYGETNFLFDIFSVLSAVSETIYITVRSHPGRQIDKGNQLLSYFGLHGKISNTESLDEFTLHNDIFISCDSTAILWPLIHTKPIIYLTPWWDKGHLPLRAYNASYCPKNKEELADIIDKLLNKHSNQTLKNNQKRFIEEIVGYTKGNSSEAHYKLINMLLKS